MIFLSVFISATENLHERDIFALFIITLVTLFSKRASENDVMPALFGTSQG